MRREGASAVVIVMGCVDRGCIVLIKGVLIEGVLEVVLVKVGKVMIFPSF